MKARWSLAIELTWTGESAEQQVFSPFPAKLLWTSTELSHAERSDTTLASEPTSLVLNLRLSWNTLSEVLCNLLAVVLIPFLLSLRGYYVVGRGFKCNIRAGTGRDPSSSCTCKYPWIIMQTAEHKALDHINRLTNLHVPNSHCTMLGFMLHRTRQPFILRPVQ